MQSLGHHISHAVLLRRCGESRRVTHTTKKWPPLIDEKNDRSYDCQLHGAGRLRRTGVGACNSTEAIVRVDGLSKTYGRVHALEDVGFSIRAGEILGLIGPNGAGKTTLFECVAGVEPADQGHVYFGQAPVDGRHRSSRLFYVPDGIAPWPDQPVRWVLEFSLGFFGGRRALFEQVVADLDLNPLMPVTICALSRGQRKRTLLALGLLAPQPILLIDEPFEGLDLRQSRDAGLIARWMYHATR